MAAVPGVEKEQPIHGARAVLGMNEHTAKLIGGQRAPETKAAVMQGVEQGQRNFDRSCFCVGQMRPAILIVGLDGRLFFGERETQTDVGVEVAVRNVMDNLPDGPAAVAVRSIELRLREAVYRCAQLGRSFRDGLNTLLARGGSDFERECELSNRVAWVHCQQGSCEKLCVGQSSVTSLDAGARQLVTSVPFRPTHARTG